MHSNKPIWLLLAGELSLPPHRPGAEDMIIAVDGGIRHADSLGWAVDLWIGDFDSSKTDAARAHIPQKRFPCDKSQTDFELALAYAAQTYPRRAIYVLGSGGGEADHDFANLWVTAQSAAPVLLWRENACIISAEGPISIDWHSRAGEKISLFAFSPLSGISNHGLRWPSRAAQLLAHQAAFARNEALGGAAGLSWQSGRGLLFLPAAYTPAIRCPKESTH